MSVEPEISVVIPTCGRVEILEETLSALLRQTFDSRRFEVLVVVDGANRASRELVAQVAERAPCPVVALEQPRAGQGNARNRGIARATGRIVLMLDDDILAVPDLLREHARHHAGRDDTVVTGAVPIEREAGEPAHRRLVRRWWERVLEEMSSPGHRPTFRDFVTGNVSVPRARLVEAGGFDPAFTRYGREDYELGYRLLRAGLRFVHEPRAIGFHRYRKEPLEWLRQTRGQGRADVIFARKHPQLAPEIMTLSPYPLVPWDPLAVAVWERLALRLNANGGRLWDRLTALAQAAHYWRGVREESRDAREFSGLLRTQLEARDGIGRIRVAERLAIARARLGL